MNTDELKNAVCDEIDSRSQEIIEIGRRILSHPELGYREYKTSEYIKSLFDSEKTNCESPFALTGVRAKIGRETGINVAVISELDAVVSYGHKFADPVSGAAHACGHNAQVASMMGALYGISRYIQYLDGGVTFFAVPAEEYIESEYRTSLIRRGKIKYKGGKQQLIYEGAFDNIDMALMVHAASECPEPVLSGDGTSLGFIAKYIVLKGKEAHAGSPDLGINALNAAALAINAINANRETFRDSDSVRIHQIITKGGDVVNTVPSDIRLEMMIRGANIKAIEDASMKVNRSFQGAAMAVGAIAEITDSPGYLPLYQNEAMFDLFVKNTERFIGADKIHRGTSMTGSTDMGDLSSIIPCIHPSLGGFSGRGHSCDFAVTNEYTAYVLPAKIIAMTVVDLLVNHAQNAEVIKDNYKAVMTKDEYLNFLNKYQSD